MEEEIQVDLKRLGEQVIASDLRELGVTWSRTDKIGNSLTHASME